ncbi:MAG TPA: pyridoxal phosphate-dependent aminotransferase [Caldilineaceae bacterium]|nr:pyridoxal phosphate-dependent aminotransferase [Caldilineaceae bacterium]
MTQIPMAHSVRKAIDQSLPPHIQRLANNQIVKIADLARDDPNVIKLWIGESDLATPDFITEATIAALHEGYTRYTYSLGLPLLREALARYHQRHWGVEVDPNRFSPTVGGMNAMMQVFQSLFSPGDELVIPVPTWPNIMEVTNIVGGTVVPVAYEISDDGTVTLDLDRLFGAVTPKTKAIAINSPANPTGWVMPREEMIALRDFARERGIWIIADEVYAHFVYEMPAPTPSFLQICEPDERLMVTNTFSKNWCMTGWRSGWVIFPTGMSKLFDRLSQYNTTSTPTFIQRGCIAALDQGDDFIKMQVERCRHSCEIFYQALRELPNVTVYKPKGSFYMWFAVDGVTDGYELAVRVLKEKSVGIAPGSAFGPGGERFLRLCFAIDPALAEEAVERLVPILRAA